MFESRIERQLPRLAAIALVVQLASAALGNDLWDDGWTKSPQNPVLSLSPGSFDSQNIFAPAIAKHNGTYYLYYSGGPSGPLTGQDYINYQIGLATSNDGVNFTKHGQPLLPLGARDNFHATPTLLRDPQGNLQLDENGTWHMFFNGNRADDVEHATSTDGVNWTKDPQGAIFQNAYAPNVLKVGNEYRMYYVHKPTSGNWQLRLATGPDIYSLQLHPDNPVLANSQPWESSSLFYPYVLQDNGVWTMFYAAYWTPGKTAMGTATSDDGIHWTKTPDNPIFTPTPGSAYDSVYTSSQAVIRDGDVYRMFYAGRVDSIHKYFSINLATKPVSAPATTFQWDQPGMGQWNVLANWSPLGGGSTAMPDGNQVTVMFGNSIAGPSTVVVQSPITVKTILFNSTRSYAIAGSAELHLEADTGDASIQVLQGIHQFQTVVDLGSDTTITAAAGTALEINNRLELNGHTLTKSGAGLLSINNTVVAGGGSVVAAAGEVSGGGQIDGDLVNAGSVFSPGNSPGQMTVTGNYRQLVDGVLRMEIAGTSAQSEHDVLEANSATLDGALEISFLDNFQPRSGDAFHILRFQSVSGSFAQVQLPTLAGGLTWDTSQLYSRGVLLAVPEPPASVSLLICIVGLGLLLFCKSTRSRLLIGS